jgi:EmrB/QacA subfamily drug resistance transporter
VSLPATSAVSPGWGRWGALAAVCLGQFMLMVDITIVLVALPDVSRDLGTSFEDVQWIVDAYALALAAFLLNAGALADRIGRRRVFTVGLILFGVASVVCGLAGSPETLIAARALQGLGGAVLLATALAIIGHEFPGRDRATALAVFGAVFGSAIAVGPLLAGALIELAGWRAIFFVNVPLALLAIVLTARFVRESRDPDPRPLDLPGQLLFTLGIVMLIGAFVRGQQWGWSSPELLALASGAVATLAVFTVVEYLRRRPMFDLSLLRERSFAGASVAAFATSASLFGMFVYLTFYFQAVEHLSPLSTGVRFLPVTIVALIAAAAAGRLSGSVAPRVMLGGALTCSTLGLAQMTMLADGGEWTVILPGLILCGVGFGVANPTVAAVTLAVTSPSRVGTATGMNSTFRQVGIAAGVAGLGALFHLRITDSLGPDGAKSLSEASSTLGVAGMSAVTEGRFAAAFVDGLHSVFIVSAAIAALGAIFVIASVRVAAGARSEPDQPFVDPTLEVSDPWQQQTSISPR